MNTSISKIIGGRYHIVQLLGEGGFGKTYLANDLQRQGHQCAVKHFTFVNTNQHQVMKAKELFQREVETLKKLNGCPYIPKFFDYVEEQEELYIIQEYIQGDTLSKIIKTQGKLQENEVRRSLDKLLDTLECIHNKNIIHRDIKPDNIIINSDGNWFLIDFGAVKEFIAQNTNLQQPGTKIHTPGYAPEEQMDGYARTNSDIYALGMTLIEALTGLKPESLPRDNLEIDLTNQQDISDELADILKRMVRYNYKERYQLVKDIRKDLTRQNPTPTQVITPPKPDKSGGDIFLLVIVLSIIFGILYAALLSGKQHTEPRKQESSSMKQIDRRSHPHPFNSIVLPLAINSLGRSSNGYPKHT